jgi:hypothetical protein
MKTVIEMAREAGIRDCTCDGKLGCLERFAELVRADERARMAEKPAQQEPVAWTLTEELEKRETTTRAHLWFSDPVNCMWTPLYTSPQPPAQPAVQQEPEYIQLRHKEEDGFSPWGQPLDPKYRHDKWAAGVEMRLLYASPQPAQRTWVGLAEMEVDDIVSLNYPSYFDIAQAIEAKLKEKNT